MTRTPVLGWRGVLVSAARATGVSWHIGPKPFVQRWAPGVLDDFIAIGLTDHLAGVAVAFVAGRDSNETRLVGREQNRRFRGADWMALPTGLLVPMEAPDACAKAVLAALCWQRSPRDRTAQAKKGEPDMAPR